MVEEDEAALDDEDDEPESVTPSAAAVAGPTLPSADRPFLRWNQRTASRVFSPYLPSAAPVM